MATATQKQRPGRQAGLRTDREGEQDRLTFVVFEDNGGDYRWMMVDGDGADLARSRPFASYEAAETSAGVVRGDARSAHVQSRPAAS